MRRIRESARLARRVYVLCRGVDNSRRSSAHVALRAFALHMAGLTDGSWLSLLARKQ